MSDSSCLQGFNDTTSIYNNNDGFSATYQPNEIKGDTIENLDQKDEIILVKIRVDGTPEIRTNVNYGKIAQRNAYRRINKKLGAE